MFFNIINDIACAKTHAIYIYIYRNLTDFNWKINKIDPNLF